MNHVDSPKAVTHLSLCTGYGGIDLGLKAAISELRTIAYCEIDAFAVANLVAKVEAGRLDLAPIWPDVCSFPFKDFHGKVDILSGGFPCQPFSIAGRRKGDEDERHLFPAILNGIRDAQPAVVFLENVSGILSADLVGTDWADPAGTPVLLHVYRELERIGYSVRGGLFSARGIGAPHRRRRVFILAHAHGLRLADWVYHCCAEREQRIFARRSRAWPAPRGASAYEWEPIRVVDGPESTANFSKTTLDGLRRSALFHSEAEPALGRIVDGITNRMDYAELCQSRDSRVEELRLLGNGVVPDVATQAFCVLMKETVDSMGIV